MNEYYLKEKRFEYVNEGFRNILHETEVQAFLQKKFSFRKAYTNLNIIYKPYFKFILSTLRPFKNILGKADPRLAALYLQDSISEQSKKCKIPIEEVHKKQ